MLNQTPEEQHPVNNPETTRRLMDGYKLHMISFENKSKQYSMNGVQPARGDNGQAWHWNLVNEWVKNNRPDESLIFT